MPGWNYPRLSRGPASVLTLPQTQAQYRPVALRTEPARSYEARLAVEAPMLPARPRRSRALRDEARLAYAILAPSLLVILFLVAYPFIAAIYLSLQDKMVGSPGRFVGLENYGELLRDEVFLRTAWNSVVRTLLFVPWAVPVVIVSLNWRWIYDDLSGFLNNFLITFHITHDIISWLSNPHLAMGCVIAVVVWAGTPFYAMSFLAGLQAIPKELYEAAEVDGASVLQQFSFITVPRLKTIFVTTVLLSAILTSAGIQFVLLLTNG